MGFFSFKKTFWVNSRFSQTPDLVSTEESVVTQVANSSSGYHQCDLPALGKKGPSWGQTGQSGEGARLDVDSSFGLRFIRKVAVFMSLNFSDLFPHWEENGLSSCQFYPGLSRDNMYQERVLHSQTERLHQVQGGLTREPQYHPRGLHFIQDCTSTNTSNDSVLSVSVHVGGKRGAKLSLGGTPWTHKSRALKGGNSHTGSLTSDLRPRGVPAGHGAA